MSSWAGFWIGLGIYWGLGELGIQINHGLMALASKMLLK